MSENKETKTKVKSGKKSREIKSLQVNLHNCSPEFVEHAINDAFLKHNASFHNHDNSVFDDEPVPQLDNSQDMILNLIQSAVEEAVETHVSKYHHSNPTMEEETNDDKGHSGIMKSNEEAMSQAERVVQEVSMGMESKD